MSIYRQIQSFNGLFKILCIAACAFALFWNVCNQLDLYLPTHSHRPSELKALQKIAYIIPLSYEIVAYPCSDVAIDLTHFRANIAYVICPRVISSGRAGEFKSNTAVIARYEIDKDLKDAQLYGYYKKITLNQSGPYIYLIDIAKQE